MRELCDLDALREVMEQMTRGGVFLSVGGERPNVMTIGWGWIGYCWGKPVFVAVVRPQRHTYGILQKTGEFTVSVPARPRKRIINQMVRHQRVCHRRIQDKCGHRYMYICFHTGK